MDDKEPHFVVSCCSNCGDYNVMGYGEMSISISEYLNEGDKDSQKG